MAKNINEATSTVLPTIQQHFANEYFSDVCYMLQYKMILRCTV